MLAEQIGPGEARGWLRRCVRHATSDASGFESLSWPEAKDPHGLCGCVGVMTLLPAGDRGAGDGASSVVAEGDATGTHWLGRRGGG